MATRRPAVRARQPLVSPAVREYLADTQLGVSVTSARAHPDLTAAALCGLVAAAIYLYSSSRDRENLDYFVRLADAFLHGRIGVDEAPSWLNELIPAANAPGLWYVPYPPFPALLLVPVVAIFGTDIHQQVVSSILGAAGVAMAYIVLRRFALTVRTRLVLTLVFGFGTVFWYVTEVGSVWYIAHVVAVLCSLAAIYLALGRRWPFAVGLLIGLATLSRLPVGLTAPFYVAMLVGAGFPPRVRELLADRRTWTVVALFGVGIAIPLAGYALYNLARWGTLFDQGYVSIPGVLQDPIYVKHGILSVWYIPRNVFAILFRSWNYVDDAPFLQPSWWGLGLFLTTPLFAWLFKARLRDPRVAWALIATALCAIPIVTHGNVGILQFGYRFSLDFQPMLLVILATVFERGMSRTAVVAAIASIVICAYAIWAISIGFVAY